MNIDLSLEQAQILDDYLLRGSKEVYTIAPEDEWAWVLLKDCDYIHWLYNDNGFVYRTTDAGDAFCLRGGFVQACKQQIEAQQIRQRELQSIEDQAKYARRAYWIAVGALIASAVASAVSVYSVLLK